MRKCINCSWEGDEKLDSFNHCPVCGDNTVEVAKEIKAKRAKKSINMDLNNDGKVDENDASIAGKVLRKFSKKKE